MSSYSEYCLNGGIEQEVATCTYPIGETFDGTPIPPDTAFFTQAGQCSVSYCSQHPVSDPIGFDDLKRSGECFRWPPKSSELIQDKLAVSQSRGGEEKNASSVPVPRSSR